MPSPDEKSTKPSSPLNDKIVGAINHLASIPAPVQCAVVLGIGEDGKFFGLCYFQDNHPQKVMLESVVRAAEKAFDATYAEHCDASKS